MPVAIPTFSKILSNSNGLTAYGLDQNVARWISGMSGQPSVTFITNLNDMVMKLKANKVWEQLDRFWLFATEDKQHAQICLKSLSVLTEVASPLWTANQGYSGNGTTSYLNTNYNPTSNSSTFTLNSSSFGIYSRTNVAGTYVDIGARVSSTDLLLMYPKFGDNKFYWYVNNSTGDASTAVTNSLGFFSAVRPNASTIQGYKNGVLANSGSINSVSIPNANMYVLANNFAAVPAYSIRQISMAFIGSGLINQTSFYNIFQEFATKQGFNV